MSGQYPHQVNIQLTDEEKTFVDKLMTTHGLSRAEIIRRCIDKAGPAVERAIIVRDVAAKRRAAREALTA